MIWLGLALAAPEQLWCQLSDPAHEVSLELTALDAPVSFVVRAHAAVDTQIGRHDGRMVRWHTVRHGPQHLVGQVDAADALLYLTDGPPIALSPHGTWLSGAQAQLLDGAPGQLTVAPPPWIREQVLHDPRAMVPCERLTVREDHALAERATVAQLSGFTERRAPAGAELPLHDAPEGEPIGTVTVRSLDRSVFTRATTGAWTEVAVRSWPRGVLWTGWVHELSTEPVGGVGRGGGGSAEGLPREPTVFVTATCDHDVVLSLVHGERTVPVGVHAAGSPLVLWEPADDRARVRLLDDWARPSAGGAFVASGLADCARGEVTLP